MHTTYGRAIRESEQLQIVKIKGSTIKLFIFLTMICVMTSCGDKKTSDECKHLKAIKQKKAASAIDNENTRELNSNIKSQCSQSVFIVDKDCKNKLLEKFSQQHNCQE